VWKFSYHNEAQERKGKVIMEEKKEIEAMQPVSQAPSRLIELAVSKGADLDKLEKLLALQERYERNEAKKYYNKAMSEFKAKPPEINKDRTVSYGSTKYNHASLYNVTEKINSELSKYGLSASWITAQNGSISVTCRITHVKGHSEETTLSAPADTSGSKNGIQAIGSTVTYLQRYTLLALTGLATYDDDDGRGSEPAADCINEMEKAVIERLIKEKGVNLAAFLKAFHVESLDALPKSRNAQAVAALRAKKG